MSYQSRCAGVVAGQRKLYELAFGANSDYRTVAKRDADTCEGLSKDYNNEASLLVVGPLTITKDQAVGLSVGSASRCVLSSGGRSWEKHMPPVRGTRIFLNSTSFPVVHDSGSSEVVYITYSSVHVNVRFDDASEDAIGYTPLTVAYDENTTRVVNTNANAYGANFESSVVAALKLMRIIEGGCYLGFFSAKKFSITGTSFTLALDAAISGAPFACYTGDCTVNKPADYELKSLDQKRVAASSIVPGLPVCIIGEQTPKTTGTGPYRTVEELHNGAPLSVDGRSPISALMSGGTVDLYAGLASRLDPASMLSFHRANLISLCGLFKSETVRVPGSGTGATNPVIQAYVRMVPRGAQMSSDQYASRLLNAKRPGTSLGDLLAIDPELGNIVRDAGRVVDPDVRQSILGAIDRINTSQPGLINANVRTLRSLVRPIEREIGSRTVDWDAMQHYYNAIEAYGTSVLPSKQLEFFATIEILKAAITRMQSPSEIAKKVDAALAYIPEDMRPNPPSDLASFLAIPASRKRRVEAGPFQVNPDFFNEPQRSVGAPEGGSTKRAREDSNAVRENDDNETFDLQPLS